jgi:glucose-6-phosphate isomerase
MPAGLICGQPADIAGSVPGVAAISLDVNGFFDHLIGERGLSRAEVDREAARVGTIMDGLEARRAGANLPFLDLPYDEGSISQVAELAEQLRSSFDTLLVLGIGGSALGTKTVIDAIGREAGGMRVEVLDNIDPVTIDAVLSSVELSRTAVNVISKSGQTAETMSQFLVVRDRLRAELGADSYGEHVIATTDPEAGTLRSLAEDEGFHTLPVPAGVGGRFSVLSPVGLLPVAAAGIDIDRLCEGAQAMDARTRGRDLWTNPAALHATLLHLAAGKRGRNIHVLMPYCDRLLRFCEWYGQLSAESLGKRFDLDGGIAEVGQTPVRALGATDQHSQIQLFIEGPHDKVITFMRVAQHHPDLTIPPSYEDIDAISYLCGHTLGELLNMEQRATELALAGAGRMTSVIELPKVDAAAIGQLFHLFEVQTLVAGALLGIDPLDQPGVEDGKRLTYAMAGREGFEELAERVEQQLGDKKEDLVLG